MRTGNEDVIYAFCDSERVVGAEGVVGDGRAGVLVDDSGGSLSIDVQPIPWRTALFDMKYKGDGCCRHDFSALDWRFQ